MRPVIAIVGRPNVGKSTLYNRLTRSKDALVDDLPGVTRDRMVGIGRVGPRLYWAVDTGGLTGRQDQLSTLLERQVDLAVEESDAIIMLADGRDGLTTMDREVVDKLRTRASSLYLAVNKAEGLNKDVVAAEFFDLGLARPPVAISARNGDGVRQLMSAVLDEVPGSGSDHEPDQATPRVAVVGRPNVGKSTLINRLVGAERMVVCDHPGTTRDSVHVPFSHHEREFVLVDTAGVRRRPKVRAGVEHFSVVRTLRAIDQVHVVVLVVDARGGITEQDARLAGLIRSAGRALVLVINKWDGLDSQQRQQVRRELARKLVFLSDPPQLFISAKFGSRVAEVMPAVVRAYDSTMASLSTGRLNAVLKHTTQAQPPPRVGHRRIKLKYAHQGGKNPPTVVIHGNLVDKIPDSYRRYLANQISREFGLVGAQVEVKFRPADNPYAGHARSKRA